MALDGLMSDNSIFYLFVVIFVRAKASVCPHILGVIVMNVAVKGDVFEFIVSRRTKNCMVLCESHQDWF